MGTAPHILLKAALEWHLEAGADEALVDGPVDRTAAPDLPRKPDLPEITAASADLPGAAAARREAVTRAQACQTLEELKQAIQDFDGLAIKKTATQIVFADGNPKAHVMLVGEAPGGDEDRLGRPFVGVSGQLLDRILKCVGLDRTGESPENALYISNILNWRPPGNRTPTPAEIEIALPFIERHIALVAPKVLIFCGGVSAKALLGRSEGISRLRGQLHDYHPRTDGIGGGLAPIPALATYHPAYLLRTPAQKKAVWADMLMLQRHIRDTALS
ncbi:MAG: uracil-DNA glycosylase [Rhodospirillales bacterium]|nr:uracil-DNA glycosylase [Alphaproteobacteria bacterium]USO04595.1 MAG: uracil-DNA glycosylase [Rhodospirillales bacterium]